MARVQRKADIGQNFTIGAISQTDIIKPGDFPAMAVTCPSIADGAQATTRAARRIPGF
jgi:hypothetical protein